MTTNDGIELCVVDDGIGFAAGERMGKRTWPPQHERTRAARPRQRQSGIAARARKESAGSDSEPTCNGTARSSPRDLNEPAAWFIVKTHMNLVVDLDRNATSTDVTALPALGTHAAVTPQ
jgi:hypothetical protein